MGTLKQVIVIRKDLNMRKGKMAAQAAHASLKAVTDLCWYTDDHGDRIFGGTGNNDIVNWLSNDMTKIVVGVESETELLRLYVSVQLHRIPYALIQDAGKTEFKNQHTLRWQ